jgi:hypothetical protein
MIGFGAFVVNVERTAAGLTFIVKIATILAGNQL